MGRSVDIDEALRILWAEMPAWVCALAERLERKTIRVGDCVLYKGNRAKVLLRSAETAGGNFFLCVRDDDARPFWCSLSELSAPQENLYGKKQCPTCRGTALIPKDGDVIPTTDKEA